MSDSQESKRGERVARLLPVVISGIFAVLAAIAGAMISWLGPNAAPPPVVVTPSKRTETAEEKLARSPISLRSWQTIASDARLSEERREKFFSQYLGKRVTWRGYVSNIADRTDADDTCFVIIYESRTALSAARRARENRQLGTTPMVRCRFPGAAREQVGRLRPGTEIVVEGTVADRVMAGSLLATDLYECKLLKATSAQVAQEETPRRR